MKRRGSTRSGVYIRRVLCSLKVCKMMHKFFCPSHQIVHNSLPKDFEISIFKKPKTYCSVCVSPLRDWVGNRCLSLLLSSSCLYSYKIIYILTGWSVLRLKFIASQSRMGLQMIKTVLLLCTGLILCDVYAGMNFWILWKAFAIFYHKNWSLYRVHFLYQ